MKPPSFAPVYATFFPILAELAQQHGYALAVHGSLQSDMDLIAMPWTEAAVSAEELMQALNGYSSKVMTLMFDSECSWVGPETKPHGRLAWSLQIGNGARLDLSVAPRQPSKW